MSFLVCFPYDRRTFQFRPTKLFLARSLTWADAPFILCLKSSFGNAEEEIFRNMRNPSLVNVTPKCSYLAITEERNCITDDEKHGCFLRVTLNSTAFRCLAYYPFVTLFINCIQGFQIITQSFDEIF